MAEHPSELLGMPGTESPEAGRPQDYRPIYPLPERGVGGCIIALELLTTVAYKQLKRRGKRCTVDGFSMDTLFHFARNFLETV